MLTWTCPVEMNRPTANSSESPGRIGNSSPHSMKTIRALNQKNCDPKRRQQVLGVHPLGTERVHHGVEAT